jgi:hypothetical protein
MGLIKEVSNQKEKLELLQIEAIDNLTLKSKEEVRALVFPVRLVILDQGLTVVLQTIVQRVSSEPIARSLHFKEK